MLVIKHHLAPSSVHGIGLFTDQPIKKGEVIWKHIPDLDLELSDETFNKLPEQAKEMFTFYGYHSKRSGNHILNFDNIRFTNHSKEGNVTVDPTSPDQEMPVVALRDIQAGEEILQNYNEIEVDPRFI
jgi:SET domain-containing protein